MAWNMTAPMVTNNASPVRSDNTILDRIEAGLFSQQQAQPIFKKEKNSKKGTKRRARDMVVEIGDESKRAQKRRKEERKAGQLLDGLDDAQYQREINGIKLEDPSQLIDFAIRPKGKLSGGDVNMGVAEEGNFAKGDKKKEKKAHKRARGGRRHKGRGNLNVKNGDHRQSSDMEVRGEVEKVRENRVGDGSENSPYKGVYPHGIPLKPDYVMITESDGKKGNARASKYATSMLHELLDYELVVNDTESHYAQTVTGEDASVLDVDVELELRRNKSSKKGIESNDYEKEKSALTPVTKNRDALLRTIANSCGAKATKLPIEYAPTPIARGTPRPVSETVCPSIETPHNGAAILPPNKTIQSVAEDTASTANVNKPESKTSKAGKETNDMSNRTSIEHKNAEESLSQAIAAIKKSCQMEMLFTQTTPAASNSFTTSNTVVSSGKHQQWSATARGSPPQSRTNIRREIDLLLVEEEWEITHGKMRGRAQLSGCNGDDAEVEENIAFSSLYINNRAKPIFIANVKFQILHLKTGERLGFKSMPNKESVKICSVSRGRVEVNVGGNKFGIGEDGMWRIRGGEKCEVQNHFSGEAAVVHISSVD